MYSYLFDRFLWDSFTRNRLRRDSWIIVMPFVPKVIPCASSFLIHLSQHTNHRDPEPSAPTLHTAWHFCPLSHTFRSLPVQQQLQHFFSGGETSICWQEDADIGKVIVPKSCQQVLHELLQGASFYGPDLTGLILTDGMSRRQLVPFNLHDKFMITIRMNDSLKQSGKHSSSWSITRHVFLCSYLIFLPVREGHPLTCEWGRVGWW